jgi:serine/threonine-protein kinase
MARALAKSPGERYATCGQFAAALQQALSARAGTGTGMATGTRPMNSPPYGTVISRHSAPSGGASLNWEGQATSRSPAPAAQASVYGPAIPGPSAPLPAMPDPRPAVPVASPQPSAPQPAPYEPLKRTAVGLEPSRHAVERSRGGPLSGIPLRPVLIGAGVIVVLLVLWLLTSR